MLSLLLPQVLHGHAFVVFITFLMILDEKRLEFVREVLFLG